MAGYVTNYTCNDGSKGDGFIEFLEGSGDPEGKHKNKDRGCVISSDEHLVDDCLDKGNVEVLPPAS